MVKIATCIGIDTDENDENIFYGGRPSEPVASTDFTIYLGILYD